MLLVKTNITNSAVSFDSLEPLVVIRGLAVKVTEAKAGSVFLWHFDLADLVHAQKEMQHTKGYRKHSNVHNMASLRVFQLIALVSRLANCINLVSSSSGQLFSVKEL